MQSITIRFPEMKCVICESVLPPGQEAFIHPTIKGPKGGKKYLHPGCAAGARSNPRRSMLRGAESKALLGFKSSKEKKREAADRHRKKAIQAMSKAQKMAAKLGTHPSPKWDEVGDLALTALNESLEAVELYEELGPEFSRQKKKGEEFALDADAFWCAASDYAAGLLQSPYVPKGNLRFNPRRGKGKRLPAPTVPHPGPADWVLKTTKELVALVKRGGPKAAGAQAELRRRGRSTSGDKKKRKG